MSERNTINWLNYCTPCKSWCCYNEKPFASEDELQKLNVSKITTKKDGSCIFLNNLKICDRYEDRPFECHIFPFDIQEIENKFVWVIWTNCPADIHLNHEKTITYFENKLMKKRNIDYINKYVAYHKINQPEKYSEKSFKILRKSEFNLYIYKLKTMKYKHTQIGYLMIGVTLAVLVLFVWTYITSSNEPVSYNSGTNFAVTLTMTIVVGILISFTSLQVLVDKTHLKIKFGYGIYKKSFPLDEIISAKTVKNHWYYGWGIRRWFWRKTWIYNVSGFDAVEIQLKNGKIYRIGTDEAKKLEKTILNSIK